MTDSFAGVNLAKPVVMGIVNVTPDSFSDGGEVCSTDTAVARGLDMVADGADILDIGGESTRPGADPVSIGEETRRVVPVIEQLVKQNILVSVDTRNPEVMEAAIAAGAGMINDVTALTHDPSSVAVAAKLGVPVILMHMQGTPRDMQAKPSYGDAPLEVFTYLKDRIATCRSAGIAQSDIAIDPGIGFGKTLEHNLQILNRINLLHETDCPIVLGVSRKSFIGKIDGESDPKQRVGGSLSAAVSARLKGVQIFRVHDVKETRQALQTADAIVAEHA